MATTTHSEYYEDLDFIGSLPSALNTALNDTGHSGSSKNMYRSTPSQPTSPNVAKPKLSSTVRKDAIIHQRSSNMSDTDPINQDRSTIRVSLDLFHLEKGTSFQRWFSRSSEFWSRNSGLWLVLLSQVLSAFMNTATRVLETEGGMPPFSVLFIRMGLNMMLALGYMWWRNFKDWPWGEPEVRLLLTTRGALGFFGIFGMFYSLKYLPLSDATVITFLAPSVAGYSSHLLLHYPFARIQQAASVVALVGVLLVARPTSLFSDDAVEERGTDDNAPTSIIQFFLKSSSKIVSKSAALEYVRPEQRVVAVLVALIGVLGGGGAYTAIKAIGSRAHPVVSVNYFVTFSFLFACVALAIGPLIDSPELILVLPSSWGAWFMIFFISIVGFAVQLLVTMGVAHDITNRATDMIYTNMFWALLMDKLVFGTVPGLTSILGIFLILSSSFVSLMGDRTSGNGRGADWEEEDLEDDHEAREEGGTASESLLMGQMRV